MTSRARNVKDCAKSLDDVRAFIGKRSGGEGGFDDVVALAEVTTDAMQALFASIDRSIYQELREISSYIGAMRAEISLLSAGEIKANRLPKAGAHLGEIVSATEEATNTIMSAAEAMLAAEAQDEKAYKALVNEKVMEIFEACSFQDLTGQRIARVIETLEHIEARIGRFAAACDAGSNGEVSEDPREKRARELLLHGPQAKGKGIAQTEIDALMASPSHD